MPMRGRGIVQKCALAAVSGLVCLLALELAVRGYDLLTGTRQSAPAVDARPGIPLHVVVDAPYLYGLNPAHPDVNSHGLRDDEFPVPKPKGVFRILVLGDSVAFGEGVDSQHAFPSRLEIFLQDSQVPIEVLNAGVIGYTTYNELEYYLDRGRDFEPDLVIVALSLNDVVNPRLHWNYTREAITEIPAEAIPNPEYDRDHVRPLLEALARSSGEDRGASGEAARGILSRSRLYGAIGWRLRLLFSGLWSPAPGPRAPTGHLPDLRAEVPTFLTGEDSIGIQVLLDESSAEWQWLTRMYSRLQAAVSADGAKFAVVLFPMAYQLDDGYPYIPQVRLAEHFQGQGAPCLDLLPTLRGVGKARAFMLLRSGYYDVWHLTPRGHLVAATTIADFLRDRHILDMR